MRLHGRFLRSVGGELGLRDEWAELAEAFRGIPEVSASEVVGPHPKGGFEVRFDLASGDVEAFGTRLAELGWRFVM